MKERIAMLEEQLEQFRKKGQRCDELQAEVDRAQKTVLQTKEENLALQLRLAESN